MKKWFALVAGFVGLYLVFVVYLLPASFIVSQLKLPQGVYLDGIQGSAWQGRIDVLTYQKLTVNKVNWSVNAWSLLSFNPSYQVSFGGATERGPRGIVTVKGLNGVLELTNGEILVDTQEIVKQLPLPIDVVAFGEIELLINEFSHDGNSCQSVIAQASWPKAKLSAFEQSIVLGDFSASLECDQGSLVAQVTPENNLGLTYKLSLKGNRISGQGYLQPGDAFPPELESMLGFLPKPDSKGRYRLRM